MDKRFRTYISSALLFLFAVHCAVGVAQLPTRPLPPPGSADNYIPPVGVPVDYNKTDNKNATDTTTKKKRERKPLESFFFDDSTRMTRVFAWSINPEYNSLRRVPVDTTLSGTFQLDYSYMQTDNGIGSANLGNVGGAIMPLNYFSRHTPREFSIVSPWSDYILRPRDVIFYNAKVPYSRLTYSMSGQVRNEENMFHFIISHNVSPSTSVNLVYNAASTKGLYMHQKTMDRYFAMSVAHTGKRYAVHGGYIYNHGNINENGGIKDDREVTDTVLMNSDQVAVWLNDANNTYRSNTVWWTQSYGIPLRQQKDTELTIQKIPTIYVGQEFELTELRKSYSAKGDTVLYKNYFINKDFSADSISERKIDFKFFMQLQPYNRDGALGLISAGIGNRTVDYYNFVPEKYVEQYGPSGKQTRNSTYVYGAIEGRVKKYLEWGADASLDVIGYRAGDLMAQGRIKLSAFTKKDKAISLEGNVKFTLTEPDYWVQSYFSNHFAWRNSFTKESAFSVSAKFSIPSIGLYLAGDYQVTQGKIYFDSLARPAQAKDPLNVLGVYLQKDFRAGGFHFNHRVLFQLSSSRVVAPVPMISAYVSYFYDFDVVKNVLNLQVGIDGRYQTKYYAMGYNPAIGQFYNQNEKEIGGYPYLDAFVAAKWKRMRILVKLQHFNENLFGTRDYFMILHQPQNRMMFKLKFSWSFYD
ncbi:MAG: putative porin [Mucinivorans sp.]